MNYEVKEQLYEGKAKQVFATNDPEIVMVHYKDDATAFNGLKKGTIAGKGVINNQMTNRLMAKMEKAGIPTHFVKELSQRETLVKRVSIVPLEVIVRNLSAGSFAKRYGVEEGIVFDQPTIEFSYKNDALGDPLLNTYHALALKLATAEEIETIKNYAFAVNEVLKAFWAECGVTLVDFKLEFGKVADGSIVLADEISPDTCRLWDAKTHEKLDKDRFRRDLGGVEDAYAEIMKRLLDQGVNIAFDTIGKCNYQPDVSRADWLSRLCAEGYDTQIVMSMDITRRSKIYFLPAGLPLGLCLLLTAVSRTTLPTLTLPLLVPDLFFAALLAAAFVGYRREGAWMQDDHLTLRRQKGFHLHCVCALHPDLCLTVQQSPWAVAAHRANLTLIFPGRLKQKVRSVALTELAFLQQAE